jgi:phosphoglycolate phosphatase-like HAD superfamily hydrolase
LQIEGLAPEVAVTGGLFMPIALFDIDGTLTASNEIDSICFADSFRDVFDIEIDTNWDAYKHTTDRGIAIEALLRAGRDASPEALTRHRTRFIQLLTSRMRFLDEIPGARAFLAELLAREWRIALCTGAWSDSAHLKLTRARFASDLPLASCDDDISREAILRRGIALAGGGKNDIVVSFGDAPWDVRAAANLQLPFIGIGGERLGRSGAAEVFEDFRDATAVFAAIDRVTA